jgi:hypothetical protein
LDEPTGLTLVASLQHTLILMAETITIMGLPFKRRNRSSKPTDHESGSSAAQVDRKPPFFRRRPSLPLSKSGALYPNQTMSAIVSPEHAMRRYHSAASIDSEDSYVQDDDLTVLDEEEELFLPSPNKPAFVGRSIVIRDEPITLERAVRVWGKFVHFQFATRLVVILFN